jgi:hypothetical protein
MNSPELKSNVKIKPETMSWEKVAKLWIDAPEDVPSPLQEECGKLCAPPVDNQRKLVESLIEAFRQPQN